MEQVNQQNRKKDTKGGIMPILMLVLTFCAVSLIHFLPIFGSIFLAYCAALWYFGIKENNIQLLEDGVPDPVDNPPKTETSHEFAENIIVSNTNDARAINKDNADRASHFVFHLVPPPPPTRHKVVTTLTPRLVQSPAK